MKKVFSGIQPTGDLHLGNYFGAVKNWVELQQRYQCIYCVVDYHSMTMPYKAPDLRDNTWRMVLQLMACGVEAKSLFIQSLVPEHTELCWILSCVTSFGELDKMTQFKEKRAQLESKDNQAFISSGLFFYPVLQAADILLYNADYVPVGKDQTQHLELSRNIAARFNHQFGTEYFTHPEPLFTEIPKLLSPADPTKKMSKSLGEKHFINLFGESERIRKQIKSAVTDSGENSEEGKMSAGIENLFNLLKACGKLEAHAALMATFDAGTLRYGDLKNDVAEALIELTQPFVARLADLTEKKTEVQAEIEDSAADIRKIARQTLREVKDIVGILNPKL